MAGRRGRPGLIGSEDGRPRKLDVIVPVADIERLRRRAELLGVTFSDYVRFIIRRACPPDLENPEPLEIREDWVPPSRHAILELAEEIQPRKGPVVPQHIGPREPRQRGPKPKVYVAQKIEPEEP